LPVGRGKAAEPAALASPSPSAPEFFPRSPRTRPAGARHLGFRARVDAILRNVRARSAGRFGCCPIVRDGTTAGRPAPPAAPAGGGGGQPAPPARRLWRRTYRLRRRRRTNGVRCRSLWRVRGEGR